MSKTFYQVIRNGEIIATRTSHREYSHAIVLFKNTRNVRTPEGVIEQPVEEYNLKVCNYARTLELAQKAAGREAKLWNATRYEIIPVTVKA